MLYKNSLKMHNSSNKQLLSYSRDGQSMLYTIYLYGYFDNLDLRDFPYKLATS